MNELLLFSAGAISAHIIEIIYHSHEGHEFASKLTNFLRQHNLL